MTVDPYTDEVTSEETKLGFILAFVPNPKAHYMGQGSIVPAVILPLGRGDRVIKLSNPDGGSSYPRQIFGTYVGGADKDWCTVLTGVEDAKLAVSAAKRGTFEVKVNPARPSIKLMCPKCTRGFTVDADHLPIDETTTCSNVDCAYEGKTEDFNAPNL